jgi:LPXTG-motif cell wall-anchored protein
MGKENIMKLVKKLLAVLAAFVMTFAMGMTTAFADNPTINESTDGTSSITVNNLRTGSEAEPQKVYIYEVYKFDDDSNAFVLQSQFANAVSGLPQMVNSSTETVTSAMIDALSDKIKNGNYTAAASDENVTDGSVTFSGLDKGLYIIIAEDPTTENPVTYNTMYARTYTYKTDGTLTGATVTVNAKSSGSTPGKTVDDADHVVEGGQVLTYTIKHTVPSFASNVTDRHYRIKDTLTVNGVADNGTKIDYTNFTVKIGGAKVANTTYSFDSQSDTSFVLNLDQYVANDNYALKDVEVSYQVKVGSVTEIDNKPQYTVKNDDSDWKDGNIVKVYTAPVAMTKYDEDTNPLSGAEFVLRKVVPASGDVAEHDEYAILDASKYLTGWTTNIDDATRVTSDENGVVTVNGLSAGDYYFHETKAPAGYALNDQDTKVTVSAIVENGVTTGAKGTTATEASMHDTKMANLPSTGGRGTLIFTIVGCGIMIAAAAYYFKSKKAAE